MNIERKKLLPVIIWFLDDLSDIYGNNCSNDISPILFNILTKNFTEEDKLEFIDNFVKNNIKNPEDEEYKRHFSSSKEEKLKELKRLPDYCWVYTLKKFLEEEYKNEN